MRFGRWDIISGTLKMQTRAEKKPNLYTCSPEKTCSISCGMIIRNSQKVFVTISFFFLFRCSHLLSIRLVFGSLFICVNIVSSTPFYSDTLLRAYRPFQSYFVIFIFAFFRFVKNYSFPIKMKRRKKNHHHLQQHPELQNSKMQCLQQRIPGQRMIRGKNIGEAKKNKCEKKIINSSSISSSSFIYFLFLLPSLCKQATDIVSNIRT